MQLTLDINSDSAVSFFKTMLVQDLTGLVNEITELKYLRREAGESDLPPHKLEDLLDCLRILEAYKVLLGHYCTHYEYQMIAREIGLDALDND